MQRFRHAENGKVASCMNGYSPVVPRAGVGAGSYSPHMAARFFTSITLKLGRGLCSC